MVRDVVDRMLALINTPRNEESESPNSEFKRFKTEPWYMIVLQFRPSNKDLSKVSWQKKSEILFSLST